MPTASGSSNTWPFLYHGMEHEFIEPNQYYYAGDGAYYSAQIMRSLSETAAQGTSGPGPGAGKARHHGGGGGGGGHGAAINGHVNAAAIAQQAVGGGGLSEPTVQSDQTSLPLIAQLFVDIGNFFSDLLGSGGGVSYPPNYFVFQHRLTFKKHQVYDVMIGVNVIVDMGPSGVAITPDRVIPGDQLFRVYGGESSQLGRDPGFYTTKNPRTMEDPYSQLGLPKGNTMERMVTGRLKGPPEGLQVNQAKPLEAGQTGGAPEVQVPDPTNNIQIESDVQFEVPDLPIIVE